MSIATEDTKIILKSIKSVDISDKIDTKIIFPEESYKFASMKFVMANSNETVRSILSQIPVAGNHKNVLVDVKVHDLEVGVTPALPHWHFDCVKDPRDESLEEVHHLFITEGCSTEFLGEDTEFDLPYGFNHSIFNHLNGVKIKPYKVYTYGRHLHRATKAVKKCKRLLIRVTESNLIKPNNRKFEVTYR